MSSPSLFDRTGNNHTNNSSFYSNITNTKEMTSSSSSSNPQHTTTTNAQQSSSSSSSSFYALPPMTNASFVGGGAPGGVSQMELEDLRQAFQLFDKENKGKILLQDVRNVLESISNQRTTTTTSSSSATNNMNRVLSRIRSLSEKNDNNNTQLSMPEFIQLMTQSDSKNDKRSQVRKVFDLFDVDQKGYINVDDLGRVAADLGEVMDRHELQEMIQRASSSSSSALSSGKVYPQDFEAVMNKRLFS